MRLPADLVSSLRPAFEGRAACVTGGAGFIGGHLVDALLHLGANVQVIDDLSTSTLDHLTDLIDLDPHRLKFVHGSILDDQSLADAVKGCGMVFHLAAMGSVPRSIEHPRRAFAVNATGTIGVLEAARAAGTKRVVLASSSSIYGDGGSSGGGGGAAAVPEDAPRQEAMPPMPLSPYAASKLAAEASCRAWSASYGLSTVALRFFNVFGPRQPADSAYAAVIPAFAKRLLAGEAPVIYGDGRQSRDFTFVANVVAALLKAAVHPSALNGQVMNIGAGRRTDLLTLARIMAEGCGVPHIKSTFAPARSGEVMHSLADVAAAKRVLGYSPFADLETGLAETVAWMREAMAGAGQ